MKIFICQSVIQNETDKSTHQLGKENQKIQQ